MGYSITCPIMTTEDAGRLSLARLFVLQDGKMDAITISDSNITDVILIDQGINKLEIPTRNFTTFIRTLQKLESDGKI